MAWRLLGKGQKDMGLLSWNMESHTSYDSCKKNSHNIMRDYPFPTMNTSKKVDPHWVQRLATNVV
jgi:hypothetical protein